MSCIEELAYLKSHFPEIFTESDQWSDSTTELENSGSSSIGFHGNTDPFLSPG